MVFSSVIQLKLKGLGKAPNFNYFSRQSSMLNMSMWYVSYVSNVTDFPVYSKFKSNEPKIDNDRNVNACIVILFDLITLLKVQGFGVLTPIGYITNSFSSKYLNVIIILAI